LVAAESVLTAAATAAADAVVVVTVTIGHEEPHRTQAVIRSNHNDVASVREVAAVVQVKGPFAPTLQERAPMIPNEHRERARRKVIAHAVVGREHVQVQAVFALVGGHVGVVVNLQAPCTESGGVSNVGSPARSWLWRLPSVTATGIRCVKDAPPRAAKIGFIQEPLNCAIGRVPNVINLPVGNPEDCHH
jgi:hypothetical protein